MAGEVIGITSIKIAATGVEGMGYAISMKTAGPIIQSLINPGYVTRPWLGIESELYTVNEWLASRYNLPVDKGALVTQVTADSPADKEAGIKPGDVITGFDDEEITTAEELIQAIYSSQIGQEVKITFWRGKTKTPHTTYATLAESPPP
jgi:serine protease Do